MSLKEVHIIRPAALKPGISIESIPTGIEDHSSKSASTRLIQGKALIFWDPDCPGQKLNAIDTDQITPAKDCVSESLHSLD